MLGHYKRVLIIGAHPDDEDTELLTLVRGMGAEAAYLSLNRGEGGQNLIGPELGVALGLLPDRGAAGRPADRRRPPVLHPRLRLRVLQDARRDLAALAPGHDPQGRSPDRPAVPAADHRLDLQRHPRDGHGQHQAAGWSARRPFGWLGTRAASPSSSRRRPAPLDGAQLYRSAWFDTTATTITLNGGPLDPADGKSDYQIAMAGRSLHRSQDMGQLQRMGPSTVRLALVEDRTGSGEVALFGGIDTSLSAMPLGERRRAGSADLVRSSPAVPELQRYSARIDSPLARPREPQPSSVACLPGPRVISTTPLRCHRRPLPAPAECITPVALNWRISWGTSMPRPGTWEERFSMLW